MESASNVSRFIIHEAVKNNIDDVSNLKLQKLLYYCQGYHLAVFGERMFPENFEAWDHGPVVREVYREFRSFQNSTIPTDSSFEQVKMPKDIVKTIDFVIGKLGSIKPWKLVRKTHQEDPWKNHAPDNAADGCVIESNEIQVYFEGVLASSQDDRLATLLDRADCEQTILLPDEIETAEQFLQWAKQPIQ